MIANSCQRIQKYLETIYDVPFTVECSKEYNDPLYRIVPRNDMEELFEVTILYRQNIRFIIEIQPQKYAATMLDEMQDADISKRKMFLHYLHLFEEKKAKAEIFINDQICNPEEDLMWNYKWKKFRIRSTRIAVIDSEQKEFDVITETMEWASLSVGMILSLLQIEEDKNDKYTEGKVSQVLTNRYERNPVNRELCLAVNGYICKVCGMDFNKVYGELGYHFIHVHHIEMVSSFGGEYYLNPEKDLVPVCPNCHAMLHRLNPPMKPDELKEIVIKNREQ